MLNYKEEYILKKQLSIFLILALVLSVFSGFGGVALAAPNIDFSVDPQITEMSEGGDVVFDYDILNTGDEVPGDVIIKCNDIEVAYYPTKLLGDGASVSDSFTMNVTNEMLGTKLKFTLYTDDTKLATTTAKIAKKELSIAIAATGKASQTLVGADETVTFTFNFENQGEATLDDIVVTASALNNGNALKTAFSLEAGQSNIITYKHTFSAEIMVDPIVSYSSGGVIQEPKALESIELKEESRNVEVSVEVDNSTPDAGEDVTFTLTVANNGNVNYTDVTVTMDGEKVSFPSSKLNKDDEYKPEYTKSFQMSTDVKFTISLKDHKGVLKSVSKTVSIQLPVDTNALNQQLQLVINVDRSQLTSAGTVNFTGYVSNTSDYSLSDIVITEASIGDIYSISSMAPGAQESITKTVDINETTTYNFVLTAKDRNGQEYTITADPIPVTIRSAEAEPTDFDDAAVVEEGDTLTLDSHKGSVGSLGAWAIIAIVLVIMIIGVGIALIVLWKKGQKPKKTPATNLPKKKAPYKNGKKKPQSTRSYKDRNNF